ncbi:MAG: type I restriction enzyme HsdR N-terminal domain-containing protein [Acidimicrobiia bacterium]
MSTDASPAWPAPDGAAIEVVEPHPVIVIDTREVAERAKAPRSAPKWETEARERLAANLKRFAKPLADLISRDANEGDTRLLVTDFLCDALGYDKYENLTTEYQVKGEFADYGVRIDKQLVAFIEVKRCTTKLGAKHLRQVQSYAVNEGVEWCILTNGAMWQVWHLTAGLPIGMDVAIEIDITGPETNATKVDTLFYLTKDSFKRRQLDELWQAKRATSPVSVAKAVLSESVLDEIRKELRRSTGHNARSDEIEAAVRSALRPDLL